MNKYILLAILAQLVVSTVPSASKIVINAFPVEPYIALRWSISSALFAAVLLLQKRKQKYDWNPALNLKIGLLGVGGYGLASLGTLYAVKIGGVSFFALLTLLSPLILVALSVIVLKEKIHARTLISLAAAIIGVLLMIKGKIEITATTTTVTAALLVILAYTFDSLTLLSSKSFRKRVPLTQYLFIAQLTTAVFMWILSAIMYPADQLLPTTKETWLAVTYVAVVSCFGVFFLWSWLLTHLQGQQLGVIEYIHGVAAALLGVALFDESLTWPMVLGSVIIFAGVLLISRNKNAHHPSPE